MRALGELLPSANDVQRVDCPASELIVGMECGGSDGHSGISSNPTIGAAADIMVAAGGSVILAETPEIYGAEHLLTKRARTPAAAEKLLNRIAWWERYTSFSGAEIDNNPTAGNKAGGLTTIYEKSLGAVAKAGTTALKQFMSMLNRLLKDSVLWIRLALIQRQSPAWLPVAPIWLSLAPAVAVVLAVSQRLR